MNEDGPPPDKLPTTTPPLHANDAAPAGDSNATLDVPARTPGARPSGKEVAPATAAASGAKFIGPYRLLQLLGEGGMGEVWMAEQKSPIHRTVALKLIKTGMDTNAVVARFEAERQALALMDHNNIARVFDAGSTAEGRPYFVMEYVPGLPLTEYCDKHRLSLKHRLELFMQVCDGVQHAHQKAIIHRDLKPSNVLVVEQDNKAAPKIIDFGLAKAMGQRLTEKTMFTEMGVMMGTPEYMSPEQADQREQNIDTRTDVYSLGAILYQLLTGALPFDMKILRAAGLEEVLRAIREEEPLKPSTRIRSLGPDSAALAEKREEEPRSFARHLQGELDWITMKAMEKDRTRRYGLPAELAADVGHYLRNEPVLAHSPSAGYRARKFARRHRFGVAAAASTIGLLVAFSVAMAIQARRIARERDRANRQAEAAQRVEEFMKGMFQVSDPSEARGNSITAREILDKASKEIDTGLANDPETQAQLMDVMGDVYESLGLYSRAQPLLEHALDIERRIHGPKNPESLKTVADLGWVLYREGRYAESEKLERETLDTSRQVLGRDDPVTLESTGNLAESLEAEGLYPEAERLEREQLDIERRVLGTETPETLRTNGNLAVILWHEGSYPEAEKMERELLDIQRRVHGPEDPDTLAVINNLALTLMDEGRYAEVEEMQRELIDIERRVLGTEHPSTLQTIGNLARTLKREGRYAEAEKMQREMIDIKRRVLGPEHPETAASVYNLACFVARQGRRDEALSLLDQAVDHGLAPYIDLAIEKDSDFDSLHGDARFAAIVADAKDRAAAQQKPK